MLVNSIDKATDHAVNEAIDMAQNRPLLLTDVYIRHNALLELHARTEMNDE